jgi:hypothetical protein
MEVKWPSTPHFRGRTLGPILYGATFFGLAAAVIATVAIRRDNATRRALREVEAKHQQIRARAVVQEMRRSTGPTIEIHPSREDQGKFVLVYTCRIPVLNGGARPIADVRLSVAFEPIPRSEELNEQTGEWIEFIILPGQRGFDEDLHHSWTITSEPARRPMIAHSTALEFTDSEGQRWRSLGHDSDPLRIEPSSDSDVVEAKLAPGQG